jgi:prepilin signal peptidase PulO-like enzyme (type II secretory pathway)
MLTSVVCLVPTYGAWSYASHVSTRILAVFVFVGVVLGVALSIYRSHLWRWLLISVLVLWSFFIVTSHLPTTTNSMYYVKICQALVKEERGRWHSFGSQKCIVILGALKTHL